MLQTITIPEAGKTKQFELTGKSIIAVSMPVYSGVNEVPLLGFNPGVSGYPLFPVSTYPNAGAFNSITITGTSESAGDELTLLSSDQCLKLSININFKDTKKSVIGETQAKQLGDAVEQFTEVEIIDSELGLPERMYLYVLGGATRGMNYAFNSVPNQGDNQAMYYDNDRSHTAADDLITIDPLELNGIDEILGFRAVATISGETPNLFWTPEY